MTKHKARWIVHTGREHGESAFWLGLSRLFVETNGVFLVTCGAWGWDADVPWSWLPRFHARSAATQQPARDAVIEVRTTVKLYLSWFGFTVGLTHKAKWLSDVSALFFPPDDPTTWGDEDSDD